MIDLRDKSWWDYLDPKKACDEKGRSKLRDDTPEEIVQDHLRYIEQTKDYF